MHHRALQGERHLCAESEILNYLVTSLGVSSAPQTMAKRTANTESDSVWHPSEELIATCALTRFLREVQKSGASEVRDVEGLHRWSIEKPELFWPSLVRFLGLTYSGECEPVFGPGEGPTPLAREWFPNMRMSFVANLLRGSNDRQAIISWSESKLIRRFTLGEVKSQVGAVQGYLRDIGISDSSRIFAYLPNIPESIVCMAATASLGAAWASCGTDYQLQGLLTRAGRVQPSVLVAAKSYLWRGAVVDLSETITKLVAQTPSIQHVILVDYLSAEAASAVPVRAGVSVVALSEILQKKTPLDLSRTFRFGHPLYLMFSSGTTGKPKGIVHGAGGTLLEHAKEMVLHGDIRPGDRVFYQTSTSWMMWNWVVSALACDATVVMYDGDPMLEEGMILWRLAQEENVTHFGTSAAFLGALQKQGRSPKDRFALSKLRALMSTGSTLYPAQFDYITQSIKPLWIQSISGGTDIVGCFGLGNPLKPVIRGEVQGKSLGYDVQVFDSHGKRVVGEEGELVCCSPAPSMPVFFLDDPGGEEYRAAYFAEYGTVWRHGDLLKETSDGGLLFLGRSDATLKPSGVRVATADIYAALARLPRVQQALAVGYTAPDATSERIILFVVLAADDTLSDTLREEIKETLKAVNTFFVPFLIIQAPDLPRTANNKLSELSVKRILRGEDPGNRSALANPESLAFFEGEGRAKVLAGR